MWGIAFGALSRQQSGGVCQARAHWVAPKLPISRFLQSEALGTEVGVGQCQKAACVLGAECWVLSSELALPGLYSPNADLGPRSLAAASGHLLLPEEWEDPAELHLEQRGAQALAPLPCVSPWSPCMSAAWVQRLCPGRGLLLRSDPLAASSSGRWVLGRPRVFQEMGKGGQ